MIYKYWNVSYEGEEGIFSQDEFKTKDLLVAHLDDIGTVIEEDDITEYDSEYEIKSVCLENGKYNEFNYTCPNCGYFYNPDKEYFESECNLIEENFEYFDRHTQCCEKCRKLFNLLNDYGDTYEV